MVLTGYNRPGQYSLKLSLVVNTHQSGRLEILGGFACFCGGLIYLVRFLNMFYVEIRNIFSHCLGNLSDGFWLLQSVFWGVHRQKP